MKKLIYKMDREMLATLVSPRQVGGAGLRPEEIIPYLNKTMGLRGVIVKLELF